MVIRFISVLVYTFCVSFRFVGFEFCLVFDHMGIVTRHSYWAWLAGRRVREFVVALDGIGSVICTFFNFYLLCIEI